MDATLEKLHKTLYIQGYFLSTTTTHTHTDSRKKEKEKSSQNMLLQCMNSFPFHSQASFGLEEFCRIFIEQDFYRKNSFRALWFVGMKSYSYGEILPILHISQENKHQPKLDGKRFYNVKQRTSPFLFLLIGFEMHAISFPMTFLFL